MIYKLGGSSHDVNALEGPWTTWASSLGLCPQCTLVLGSSFPFLESSIPKPKLAPIPSAILSLGHKNPEWGGYPLNLALQPHTPSLTLNFLPVSLTPMAKLKTQLFPHLLPESTWIPCLPVLLFFSQTLKQLSSSFFLSPFKNDFINENPTETSSFSVANQYQIPRSLTSQNFVRFSFHQHPTHGMSHSEGETTLKCTKARKRDFLFPGVGRPPLMSHVACSNAMLSDQNLPKLLRLRLNRKQAHGSRRNNTFSAKSNKHFLSEFTLATWSQEPRCSQKVRTVAVDA